MNVSAVKAYSNPLVQGSNEQNEYYKLQSNKSQSDKTQNNKASAQLSLSNSNNSVVTRKERDFFIKMFPDNSDQLERHVLFTRNGKVQSSATRLGSLVDGRI
jgi:hypothetical protein